MVKMARPPAQRSGSVRPLARERGRERRLWPWLVIALIAATVAAASAGDRGLVRLFRLRAEHARIVARNAEIETDNARLRKEVQLLREDRRAIEKIAREELGMARPNELVFQIAP
jgi:cell division protein FtsB